MKRNVTQRLESFELLRNRFGRSLLTTVVGSQQGLSIEEIIRDQVDSGIDVVSTGQLVCVSDGMIVPYLEGVNGVELHNVGGIITPILGERISLSEGSTNQLRVIKEIERGIGFISSIDTRSILKGILTGPNTLVDAIPPFGFSRYYRGEHGAEGALADLSNLLVRIGGAMARLGIRVIQLDEPILSRQSQPLPHAYLHLEHIAQELKQNYGVELLILHVCGEISDELFNVLVRLKNVDVLDFEFASYPSNLRTVSPSVLRDDRISLGKKLSYGVISTQRTDCDEAKALRLLDLAIDTYGYDLLAFIKPDCGQGKLDPQIASRNNRILGQLIKRT